MKQLCSMFIITVTLLLVLVACPLQVVPGSNVVVVTATPAPSTPSPSNTALAAVNLLPPMQIGSTFTYVDGSTLVAVPGGPFTRGRQGGTDNPQQTVTLSDFWIYRTKVTNQQYKLCVATGVCTAPDLNDNQGYNDDQRLNDPVSGVTWDQADAYCGWVHGQLPTEAQWEKTARGDDARLYPWGNNDPSCDLLNYNNCVGKTTDVNTYPQGKSPYEALDMAGNAFEWVNDWYDPQYYLTGPSQDPPGPSSGQTRSVRSSSYWSKSDQVPVSVRFSEYPDHHRGDLGFRCVVSDPSYFAPMCQQSPIYGPKPGGSSNPGTACNMNVNVIAVPAHCDSGITYVTFTSNSPNTTTVKVPQGCIQTGGGNGFPKVYKCGANTSGQTAEITAYCDVFQFGVATCAAHYIFDKNSGKCIWVKPGTTFPNCPAGTSFDAANQCCSVTPGSAWASYPLCASGSWPLQIISQPPSFACVSGSQPVDKKTQITMPQKCRQPPGGQCPAGEHWKCVGNECGCTANP